MGGVSFDSTDDNISCGAGATLANLGSISLSVWIFIKSNAGQTAQRILDKTGSISSGWRLFFSPDPTQNLEFDVFYGGGASTLISESTINTVTLNSWTNIITTWSGSSVATNAKIFVNGVEVTYKARVNATGTRDTDGGLSLFIGNRSDFTRTFDGYISETAIWSSVLAATAITALNVGRVKGLPLRVDSGNLVSYWPMDDIANGVSADGQTFRDRQGTNTGTGNSGRPSSGPLNGATFVSTLGDLVAGAIAWTSASNASANDATYASAVLLLNQYTEYLKATNFSFSIPTNATVLGIKVEVEKQDVTLNAGSDNAVRIVQDGGIGTTDKASATAWPTAEAYTTYGTSTDLWGLSWTPTQINSTGFGFAFSAKAVAASTPQVDHIRTTVFYTAGLTGTVGEPMAYLLQNDKNRGLGRGLMNGGIS